MSISALSTCSPTAETVIVAKSRFETSRNSSIHQQRAPGRYKLYPVRIGVIPSIDQRGLEFRARCRDAIDFRI
jgi:hypothetical protein